MFVLCRESEKDAGSSPCGGAGEGHVITTTTSTTNTQPRGARGSTGGVSSNNSISGGGNGGNGALAMDRRVSGGNNSIVNGGGSNNTVFGGSSGNNTAFGGSDVSSVVHQGRGDNTSSGSTTTAAGGGVSGGCGGMGGVTRVTTTGATTGTPTGAATTAAATGRRTHRLPSLRLANGRVAVSTGRLSGSDEEVRSPRTAAAAAAAAALREDIKISLDTTTCTDSLITAVEDETAFVNDFIAHEMNYKEPGKVHFVGGDEISLYGTPKEEMVPSQVPSAPPTPGVEPKPSFLKNQLQALFQPTDNKLAMKLFGSKKALMKERIRQKAAGHWIIHPCSNFR